MAVGAKTTASDACFGFSKVATSSEHEQATFCRIECQVFQGLNQIKVVKCLMNLSNRCGQFQYAN